MADRRKAVKCVVWDLDNTLWDGVLLEDGDVTLRPGVRDVVLRLDELGILNSVASRNDADLALAKLDEFGLREYFLVPQINWNPKSSSVRAIATELNIGVDTLAFIDDQPYEREEVAFSVPEVLCLDAAEVGTLLDRPEFRREFVTEDARRRRLMYLADDSRKAAEEDFAGPTEEFLASLGMAFRIRRAGPEDLRRAEELTVRTNQLNTTGYTYSYEELDAFRTSAEHLLLVAELEDRFGPYGTIGLALVELGATAWTVKLMLMSCRVMARGVGVIMINYVRRLARDAGVALRAEFVSTGRNRMMYATYKFNKFVELDRRGDTVVFGADLADIPPDPSYVDVNADGVVAVGS